MTKNSGKGITWKFGVALFSMAAAFTGLAQQPAASQPDLAKILADAEGLVEPAVNPPPAPLVKPGDKISFMGDSITQQAGYVRLVDFVLKTKCPDLKLPPFVNTGVSGQKAENMEPRFEKDMKLADKPAWAFISVGINDVWHRVGQPHDPAVLAAYKENVAKMVDKAQAAGTKAVLLAPTVIQEDPNSEGNKRLVLYVDAMKSVAAEKKCEFVDLHGMFLKAIAKKPADLKLTGDGVHMGVYGDAIMAIGVLRALGISDATISATDTTAALTLRLNTPLQKASELLEVPIPKIMKLPGAGMSF